MPHPSLDLDEHMPFQRRSWRAQRIAWVAMALILLAALLGAFGRGPLSDARAASDDGSLSVRYDRIARNQAPLELRVRFADRWSGPTTLWVSTDYLERLRVKAITPEPAAQEAAPDRLRLVFDLARGGEVLVRFETEGAGVLRAAIGIEGTPTTVSFRQTVLP